MSIRVDPWLAEWAASRLERDLSSGALRLREDSLLFFAVAESLQRRTDADAALDAHPNLTFVIPSCRGKDPSRWCRMGRRGVAEVNRVLRMAFRNDLYTFIDGCRRRREGSILSIVRRFQARRRLTTISEDALIKSYYRWRSRVAV